MTSVIDDRSSNKVIRQLQQWSRKENILGKLLYATKGPIMLLLKIVLAVRRQCCLISAVSADINVSLTLSKQKHMAAARIALVGVLSSVQYRA